MRIYETGTVFHPELTEEQLNELISRIEGEIEKGGGKITEIDQWGPRKLAYRIQRQQRGYYTFFKYAAPPSTVAQLEYQLRVFEGVIRFMTIKVEEEIDERDMDSIIKVHKKPEVTEQEEVEEEEGEEEEEEEEKEEEIKRKMKTDEKPSVDEVLITEKEMEKGTKAVEEDESPAGEETLGVEEEKTEGPEEGKAEEKKEGEDER